MIKRFFWLKLMIRELIRNKRTDYSLKQILFGVNSNKSINFAQLKAKRIEQKRWKNESKRKKLDL